LSIITAMPETMAEPAAHTGRQLASGSLHARVVAELPNLPAAQKRLAEYLLRNLATASDLSITDLAEEAEVSVGTVSQFYRRLGMRGYQDLRLGWAREAVTASAAGSGRILDLQPSDGVAAGPVENAILRVFGANTQAQIETAQRLNRTAVEVAVTMISAARRVEWVGAATAGLVAAEGSFKLRKLGIDSVCYSDSHQQSMSAALLTDADAIVAVSHSGRTDDVLRSVRVARDAGARVIAITGAAPSPLVRIADVVLSTVSYDTAFQIEPMASTIAELGVVQLLFLLLLEQGEAGAQGSLERTQAAVESTHTKGRYR
jgi:RpiR family transcriptional regulator, carbohydrate utilization regulator